MASTIETALAQIESAVYGKDVRSAIHDSISLINTKTNATSKKVDDFVAGNLDTNLTAQNLPPQSKAVGDRIRNLEYILNDPTIGVIPRLAALEGKVNNK